MDAISIARKGDMLDLREKGLTLAEIGKQYGLSRQRVAQIVGKTGRVVESKHPSREKLAVIASTKRLTRFLKRIKVMGDCWVWQGQVDPNGYGRFAMGYAHRFSYQTYYGSIPEGKLVCHTCDNPSCVNPDHLYAGTQVDNMRDRDAHGRTGKRAHSNEYYEQRAQEIREAYATGESGPAIAERYHTHASTVYNAIHRPDQNAREK